MSIPLKEYLIFEARKLGIKPHSLYMRIHRGSHTVPVVRNRGRIALVVTSDPKHSKWVKHSELVTVATDAIRAVYADQTVDREQTLASLEEIKELIETLQVQIPT